MKKVLFFLVISAVIAGCSSDDSESLPLTDNVFLKSVVRSSPDDRINYTYDGDKIVSAMEENGSGFKFIYEGSNIISIVYASTASASTGPERFKFVYNRDKLVQVEINRPEVGHVVQKNLTYVNNSLIISETFSNTTDTGELQHVQNETYTIGDNGEVVQSQKTNVSTGEQSPPSVFVYDNKKNPFRNVRGFSAISFFMIDDDMWAYFSIGRNHNLVTTNYLGSTFDNYRFFEYRDDGYPEFYTNNFDPYSYHFVYE